MTLLFQNMFYLQTLISWSFSFSSVLRLFIIIILLFAEEKRSTFHHLGSWRKFFVTKCNCGEKNHSQNVFFGGRGSILVQLYDFPISVITIHHHYHHRRRRRHCRCHQLHQNKNNTPSTSTSSAHSSSLRTSTTIIVSYITFSILIVFSYMYL